MTRDEALLKLLRVEPETKARLLVITGWPCEETAAVLARLIRQRRVRGKNGMFGSHGARTYSATS